MVVVKQCIAVKIFVLILVTEISQIGAAISNSGTANDISNGISNTSNELPVAPSRFPEPKDNSVPGPTIYQLEKFAKETKEISGIIQTIRERNSSKLPVILYNNTQRDTPSFNENENTNEHINSIHAEKYQLKTIRSYNNEFSRKTTIIFLVSVAMVSTFFYILLVSLRKLLERKYGDKELLFQKELKREDFV